MINLAFRLNSARRVDLTVNGIVALVVPIVVVIVSAPATRAQSASSAQSRAASAPKFEVASIKPCSGESGGGGGRGGGSGSPESSSPGRLTVNCKTVMGLIREAYIEFADGKPSSPESMLRNIMQPPVEGGPAWINSDSYTIDAKAEGTPGEGTMKGPMLQALLEDRFRLKIHRETRETPVYALTVAKGGLKIRQVQEGSCTPFDITQFPPPELGSGPRYCRLNISERKGRNMIVDTEAMSLGAFCKTVLMFMDRPVIDKTGTTGLFNFQMVYSIDATSSPGFRNGFGPVDEPSADPPGPSIFTALQQLGLKLEATGGRREFAVIDSVERPSEN